MNPMIPFACLVSFVAGFVAALLLLEKSYYSGIRDGIQMAADYLESAAKDVPTESVDCVMSLASELRAM